MTCFAVSRFWLNLTRNYLVYLLLMTSAGFYHVLWGSNAWMENADRGWCPCTRRQPRLPNLFRCCGFCLLHFFSFSLSVVFHTFSGLSLGTARLPKTTSDRKRRVISAGNPVINTTWTWQKERKSSETISLFFPVLVILKRLASWRRLYDDAQISLVHRKSFQRL